MSFKSVKLDHCSSQKNNAKIAKVVSNVAWQCSDHASNISHPSVRCSLLCTTQGTAAPPPASELCHPAPAPAPHRPGAGPADAAATKMKAVVFY